MNSTSKNDDETFRTVIRSLAMLLSVGFVCLAAVQLGEMLINAKAIKDGADPVRLACLKTRSVCIVQGDRPQQ